MGFRSSFSSPNWETFLHGPGVFLHWIVMMIQERAIDNLLTQTFKHAVVVLIPSDQDLCCTFLQTQQDNLKQVGLKSEKEITFYN